jgi:hypothetical protein
MRSFKFVTVVTLIIFTVLASVAFVRPASATSPYCTSGGGHRVAQNTPVALLPEIAQVFAVAPDVIGDASFVRCAGGKLMACWVGANLDCDKADRRRSLPGATAWCRDNPDADNVPMVATGHGTIYQWRCVGRRAIAGKIITPVDAQGYVAGNWKEVQ